MGRGSSNGRPGTGGGGGARAIPQSAVSISNSEYMRSHGRSPSGWGRWGFDIGGGQTVWLTGLYSNVKKDAIKRAAQQGNYTVKVLP